MTTHSASHLGTHFLAGLSGTSITPAVKTLIQKHHVLGFTLFKRNFTDTQSLIALNQELKALAKEAGYDLLLAVDQEGGRVFRLPAPFTQVPPMREWSRLFASTQNESALFSLGKILGSEVKQAGFDIDFAPVVDLDLNPHNPIIADRSFSADANIVTQLAAQVIRGLLDQNIIPCLKHFPGHGATFQDSHKVLPQDSRTLNELKNQDLIPYQKLIQQNLCPAVMTAHILFPNIDDQKPATLSAFFLSTLLRQQLQFDGVVFSDDFLMKAVADNFDLTESAGIFLQSGGDVVLICDQPELTCDLIEKLSKQTNPALLNQLAASKKRIQQLHTLTQNNKANSQSLNDVTAQNALTLKNLWEDLKS